MSELVRIEERGDVALVTIDRPPANAMDLELLEAGHAVLGDLAGRDPAAVVLAGREGFFSAGVDLKLAPTLDAAGQRAMVEGINRLFAGWYSLPAARRRRGHRPRDRRRADPRPVRRLARGGDRGQVRPDRAARRHPVPRRPRWACAPSSPAAVARRLVLRAELLDPAAALELGLFDELAEPAAVVPRALEVADASWPPSRAAPT